MSLLAVHISDGVLSPLFLVIGFAVAGLLLLPAVIRVQDEEIPRIGLLTAAFFVASLIHVKVGITSVHLLLNGLVGIVLGRRAPLAITVAIVLQAFLLAHGGFTTIGVNAVMMAVPALIARQIFVLIVGSSGPSPRRAIVGGAIASVFAVLLTAALYSGVILAAGVEDFRVIAALGFLVHIPLAAIEGAIGGVVAGYIARVKPEMLRGVARPPQSLDQNMLDYDDATSARSRTGS